MVLQRLHLKCKLLVPETIEVENEVELIVFHEVYLQYVTSKADFLVQMFLVA